MSSSTPPRDASHDETSSSPSTSSSSSSPTSPSQLASDLISSPLFYVTFGIAGGVAVVRQFENAAFLLSALPIIGLTVLSKTNVGERLQRNITDRSAELENASLAQREARDAARKQSRCFGDARPTFPWTPPPHLNGTLAGDYGFDPLRLSASSSTSLDRMVELELLHARWAMLGVVGVALPEALHFAGVLPPSLESVWWKVGAAKLHGESLNYLGIGGFVIAGKQGVAVIAACQAVLMGGPEYARSVGIKSLEPVGVHLPGDKNYPGGAPFDPLGLSDNAEAFVENTVRELNYGRLAMLAMLGCFAQAWVTREGPVANLVHCFAAWFEHSA